MKKYIIYQITNTVNKRIYIGKHETVDVNDGYMGSGKLLKRAQSKHGIQFFVKEILHVFDTEDEMNTKEAELVTEEFCKRIDTYNICVGGKGGFSYINNNPDQFLTEKRLASLRLGHTHAVKQWKHLYETDEDFRLRRREISKLAWAAYKEKYPEGAFKGKKHTEKTKRIIGEKNALMRGERNSQYGSMWITNGIVSQKIKTDDNIPEGWYKGRVIKK
jgi:hypothetical protein